MIDELASPQTGDSRKGADDHVPAERRPTLRPRKLDDQARKRLPLTPIYFLSTQTLKLLLGEIAGAQPDPSDVETASS